MLFHPPPPIVPKEEFVPIELSWPPAMAAAPELVEMLLS
jgi:hypothetical protein